MIELVTTPITNRAVFAASEDMCVANRAKIARMFLNVVDELLFNYGQWPNMTLKLYYRIIWLTLCYKESCDDHASVCHCEESNQVVDGSPACSWTCVIEQTDAVQDEDNDDVGGEQPWGHLWKRKWAIKAVTADLFGLDRHVLRLLLHLFLMLRIMTWERVLFDL